MSMPSTEAEYVKMFGAIDGQKSNTINLRNNIALEVEVNPLVKFIRNRDDFGKAVILADPDKPIILIGHNEQGNFRLPEDEMEFGEMDKIVKNAKKLIIYLSCNASEHTKNVATNFTLTYKEAIELGNKIDREFRMELNTPNFTISNTENKLNDIITDYKNEKAKKQAVKIAAITGTGIAYGVYKIKEE